MTLLCLIGRHGAGKSTVGQELAKTGFKHVSVGLLRRLARAREFPVDVPYALMVAMRRSQPGTPMRPDVAAKLLEYAGRFPNCILDGFPSAPEHLDMLPASTIIGVVTAPASIREERLFARAIRTSRAWVPGRPSEREMALGKVILLARKKFQTVHCRNAGSVQQTAGDLLERIYSTHTRFAPP